MKTFMHRAKSLSAPILWGIISSALLWPALRAGAFEPRLYSRERLENPLGESSTIPQLIGTIADAVFKIGVPVAALFIIYSGLMFVTARGSEDRLKKAKTTFMWTIVGTAVLLGAKVIAAVVKETVKAL